MRGEVRRDVSQACNPITQHTAHSNEQRAYTARTCTCTYLLASQVRDHDLERLLQKTEDIHAEQVLDGCGAGGAVLVGEKCELQHGIVFVFPLGVGLRGKGQGEGVRVMMCTGIVVYGVARREKHVCHTVLDPRPSPVDLNHSMLHTRSRTHSTLQNTSSLAHTRVYIYTLIVNICSKQHAVFPQLQPYPPW